MLRRPNNTGPPRDPPPWRSLARRRRKILEVKVNHPPRKMLSVTKMMDAREMTDVTKAAEVIVTAIAVIAGEVALTDQREIPREGVIANEMTVIAAEIEIAIIAVRVRYSLKSWGYITNDKCAVCNRVENIEHCFLACPRVVRVWHHFSAPLSRVLDSTFVVSIPSVFYPLFDFQHSHSSSLSNFLIVTILYWIWSSRNLATFRNSLLSSQNIIYLIKNDVKSRITCATDDSVRNFSSFRSAFCSVDDDVYHFSFVI